MTTGIFIRPVDLQRLEDVKYAQSVNILNKMRDSLGKSKNQKITFREYCQFRGISIEEVQRALSYNNI